MERLVGLGELGGLPLVNITHGKVTDNHPTNPTNPTNYTQNHIITNERRKYKLK